MGRTASDGELNRVICHGPPVDLMVQAAYGAGLYIPRSPRI
ncbi:hypothetical protein EBBID32_45600 [Sphingobium indicum BiD32]|uniref:Uncharacterized protein n=1 Tax=Sphingobium indicum BiD32 TaxID=1301087 RepID=N1MTA4_9SPHN|nr:hypothetical protein EBBID32_45600 [Sphingobium indicum BiD32]